MRKNVLDINSLTSVGGVIGQGFDILGSTLDNLTAFLGRSVSLQLISATKPDGNFVISFSYYSHLLITNFLHPQLYYTLWVWNAGFINVQFNYSWTSDYDLFNKKINSG